MRIPNLSAVQLPVLLTAALLMFGCTDRVADVAEDADADPADELVDDEPDDEPDDGPVAGRQTVATAEDGAQQLSSAYLAVATRGGQLSLADLADDPQALVEAAGDLDEVRFDLGLDQVLLNGVDAEQVAAGDLDLRDGLALTARVGDQACTITGTATGGGETVRIEWDAPDCADADSGVR